MVLAIAIIDKTNVVDFATFGTLTDTYTLYREFDQILSEAFLIILQIKNIKI